MDYNERLADDNISDIYPFFINSFLFPDFTCGARHIKQEMINLKKHCEFHGISGPFTTTKLVTALEVFKIEKAPGFDNIHPEFLTNYGEKTRTWLKLFYSNIL